MRIDLKKDRKDLYRPGTAEFEQVDIGPMTYLAVDGHGDPNTAQQYFHAVTTLYSTAYAIRAAFTTRTGDDFVVGPLEGLWASDDPSAFTQGRKQDWNWSMLIPLPGEVGTLDIELGRAKVRANKPQLDHDLLQVRTLQEGRCLQILHIGGYDSEAPTLARLHHEVMPALGLTFNGDHHEIYLSDPRKVPPEKLKTILRQPVTAAG